MMFFVVSMRCVRARPASSNIRSLPEPVASAEAYAMATEIGPLNFAVVVTRNSHAFHLRPNVVERVLAIALTVVIPDAVTLGNVTRTSRTGSTWTLVPVGVVT